MFEYHVVSRLLLAHEYSPAITCYVGLEEPLTAAQRDTLPQMGIGGGNAASSFSNTRNGRMSSIISFHWSREMRS